jgi:hypothetical protein
MSRRRWVAISVVELDGATYRQDRGVMYSGAFTGSNLGGHEAGVRGRWLASRNPWVVVMARS